MSPSNDIESINLDSETHDDLRYASLWRLTGGIPQHELKTVCNLTVFTFSCFVVSLFMLISPIFLFVFQSNKILSEASECEHALEKEIAFLEAAVKEEGPIFDQSNENLTSTAIGVPPEYDPSSKGPNHLSSAKEILSTSLTPLDRYFTVSSLIGRLREPLDTPVVSYLEEEVGNTSDISKKKTKSSNAAELNKQRVLRQYKKMAMLKTENEIYTQIQTDNTALLALVKRISNHRTAAVFRRAVDPKEAPGYEDKILFPVDMTLIKKFVLCGHINTFEKLHQYIAMICHNCIKYNGRYSDYAAITKEFESYVDDSFLDFMQKQKDKVLSANTT